MYLRLAMATVQLKYLERDEFYDLRRLTRIRLDGNRLSVVIDNLFERQKNLRRIGKLNGNCPHRIEWQEANQKNGLTALRYLVSISFSVRFRSFVNRTSFHPDLSRNMLAKVTNGAFAGLTNLTHLDLSYNKLGKLEATSVRSIFNLQVLNISGNMQIDLFDIRDTFVVS